jgi:mannitol 2-dehydrogenase
MISGRVSNAIPLCEENLGRLPAQVAVPGYDRRALRGGVVHMSVGSFHRSHQAVYFDDLAERGERDWGIVGVGLRRPRLQRALTPQDGLYTVVARGAEQEDARVVGAMTRYLFAPQEGRAVLSALTDETTALVTLTITGSAYGGSAPAEDGPPCCAIGYLVEALDRRRRMGRAPLTVLSCDNLPENGAIARRAVMSFARGRDAELASWIEDRVAFPNSMVDRITPQTTLGDREALAREFGVLDRWPVVTEPYSEWVLEDSFCNRRPPLDEVGVRFVDDVTPYALMKTRLLNATHCALGYLGSMAGLGQTDDAMRDPVFRAYAEQLMRLEIASLLPAVAGVDLDEYVDTLLERLANPKIGDELSRLCRAGSAKVPSHVAPSLAAARDRGTCAPLLTLALAGWLRFLRGGDWPGGQRELDDPLGPRLRALAQRAGADPRPLLAEVDGLEGLAGDEELAESLEAALAQMERLGVRDALATYVAEDALVA